MSGQEFYQLAHGASVLSLGRGRLLTEAEWEYAEVGATGSASIREARSRRARIWLCSIAWATGIRAAHWRISLRWARSRRGLAGWGTEVRPDQCSSGRSIRTRPAAITTRRRAAGFDISVGWIGGLGRSSGSWCSGGRERTQWAIWWACAARVYSAPMT